MSRTAAVFSIIVLAVLFAFSSYGIYSDLHKKVEAEKFKAELAEQRAEKAVRQREATKDEITALRESLAKANREIKQLKKRIEDDNYAHQLEIEQAVEKALDNAEELIRKRKLERLKQQAEERERQREQARKKLSNQ